MMARAGRAAQKLPKLRALPGGPRDPDDPVAAAMIPPDRISRFRSSSAWQGIRPAAAPQQPGYARPLETPR